MKPIVALFALALLAACATPTPYAAATRAGGPGYSETRIEDNRYRVTFVSNGGGAQRAYDLALRRAAELTLQNQYEWFMIDSRFGERAAQGSGPRVSLGVGGADFGRHSAVGVSTGVGFDLGGGPAATTSLEIRMGRGQKPQDASVYDAKQVAQSMAGAT